MADLPIILRPIVSWPGEMSRSRLPSPFDSTIGATHELLRREVRQLGRSREIIVQIGVSEDDFKNDGGLRSRAQVRHPGVIVSFDSRQGPMSYACDRFTTRSYRVDTHTAWHVNLRAIALALEALRKVDRYGVHGSGDQYTGFRALGSGIPMPQAQMTLEDAARLLIDGADDPVAGPLDVLEGRVDVGDLYRRAAKAFHPDVGGDPDGFKRLTEARDLLLAHA